tara:strand:+ start:738 stop:896 length:159 start_codon:yes stop_codon:yes gene_type:complete
MSELDYHLWKEEWEQSGSKLTLVEWIQNEKLERRMEFEELQRFLKWAMGAYA